jgi:hypothetical protein
MTASPEREVKLAASAAFSMPPLEVSAKTS